RLGPFPGLSLDIDVVFDLMIHDLDVVLSIVGAEVEAIEAVGVPVLTGRVDIANARLRFANGCIANITASRISRDRVRKIRFFQPATYLSIDYATQKVEMWRVTKGSGPMPSIEGGGLEVAQEEALARALAGFVDAIVSHRDRKRLLARVAEPVSPDLEIAAVTDRACKSPGGGPALLFEKPAGYDMPVATNIYGSNERMCLALGVTHLDDLAKEIDELMTP